MKFDLKCNFSAKEIKGEMLNNVKINILRKTQLLSVYAHVADVIMQLFFF